MSRSALSIPSCPAGPRPDQVRGDAAAPTLRLRLGRLRTAARDRVLPELILILEQLPATELSVAERVALLHRLERTVVRVAAVLVRARAMAAPVTAGRPPGVSLEQRLYEAMARASIHLLHELDRGQGFFSPQHSGWRVWAIRAALRFFSRELLFALATGRPWPPGAWLALHDFFVYLVMRGTVRIQGESPAAADDELDPELAYKRLIMIGLTAQCCARRRLNRSLITALRGLAAASRLVAADGLIGEFGLILVDVSRDLPAERRIGCLDDPFRGWVLRVPEAFDTLLGTLGPGRRGSPGARR